MIKKHLSYKGKLDCFYDAYLSCSFGLYHGSEALFDPSVNDTNALIEYIAIGDGKDTTNNNNTGPDELWEVKGLHHSHQEGGHHEQD